MSFDIATASSYERLNEGAFFHFTDAAGKPLYDGEGDDKKPIGVKLRGRNSREGLAAQREIGNRRLLEARRPGGAQMSVESNERTLAEVLAACTISWTFTELDGKPFPCTRENALAFWNDDRFRRWRDAADDFISAEAGFTKG